MPVALERAGITIEGHRTSMEVHEAFAAQVLSNFQWFASDKIARERLRAGQGRWASPMWTAST